MKTFSTNAIIKVPGDGFRAGNQRVKKNWTMICMYIYKITWPVRELYISRTWITVSKQGNPFGISCVIINRFLRYMFSYRWIIDFLLDRFQRVKLAEDCYSEWDPVPSGVPQGTKLGLSSYDKWFGYQQCQFMDVCRWNYGCRSCLLRTTQRY